MVRVYNLIEEVLAFSEEENLVHAENFGKEHFVSKLAYFQCTEHSMQGNDTNIVVTNKVNALFRSWACGSETYNGKVWPTFPV
jgi:hypothetical protein